MPNKITRLSRYDTEHVFKNGGTTKGEFVVLKYIKEKNKKIEFCVVISKNVLKKAIERNKTKRRMRYIINKHKSKTKNGTKIIVVLKKNTKFSKLENEYIRLLNTSKLCQK